MSTGHEKKLSRNVLGVRRPRNAWRAVSIIDSGVDFGAENEEVVFI